VHGRGCIKVRVMIECEGVDKDAVCEEVAAIARGVKRWMPHVNSVISVREGVGERLMEGTEASYLVKPASIESLRDYFTALLKPAP